MFKTYKKVGEQPAEKNAKEGKDSPSTEPQTVENNTTNYHYKTSALCLFLMLLVGIFIGESDFFEKVWDTLNAVPGKPKSRVIYLEKDPVVKEESVVELEEEPVVELEEEDLEEAVEVEEDFSSTEDNIRRKVLNLVLRERGLAFFYPEAKDLNEAEDDLWERMEKQIKYWKKRFPIFEEFSISQQAALISISFEIRDHLGRSDSFEEEFGQALIAIGDQTWKNSKNAAWKSYARNDKWARVTKALTATKWAREESPRRAHRSIEIIHLDWYPESLSQNSFEKEQWRLGYHHDWFKELSEARQLAIMDLVLIFNVSHWCIEESFPMLSITLQIAVVAEKAEHKEAAQQCYQLAAGYVVEESVKMAKSRGTEQLLPIIQHMISEDQMYD